MKQRTNENMGRPSRDGTKKPVRKVVSIKLTLDEYEDVCKLAEKFDGNINKLFRARILGAKNG